ncbi:MAG: DUF362 domain-containing protein [Planctomycetes bacterium]|nr:DUF362 domain-containing protein [Planctomycetota bacterium]MBL7040062.1 DUF362 domain-containing protein [Pirellulaceae bacterium]
MGSPRMGRRAFLGGVSAGVVGSMFTGERRGVAQARGATDTEPDKPTQVALIKGDDRRRNVRESLLAIEKEVREAIGSRQVVIKPNFVTTNKPLAATHVEAVVGILDFLKPFYKQTVVIAESPAGAPAAKGYESYGYTKLTSTYDVSLDELDADRHRTFHVLDTQLRPTPVRMARMLCDPDFYVISAAVMKTHNAVVATLGLKNVVVGGALKFGRRSDKRQFHQGTKLINYNMFLIAQHVRPALTVIDGYQGMEGNGPTGGTAVDSRIAIAGTDVVATDRIGLEVMGVDFADVGYLNYCADAGLGQGDRSMVGVVGADPVKCVQKYKMHDRFDGQMKWKSDDFQTISLEGDIRS